jgi:hypothetical protein
MIDLVLPIIVGEMNVALQRSFPSAGGDKMVVLANLMDQSGNLNDFGDDKIVCALVNVQEEQVKPNAVRHASHTKNDPVFLNLSVLFAAYFKDYTTSLKSLSAVVGFFQDHQVMTPQKTPALAGVTDKITAEIINLETRDLSSLWGMLGAKYMPSIIYKLKIITIDQKRMIEPQIPITEIQGDIR